MQVLEFLDNSDLELPEDESPAAGDDQIYSENCDTSESVVTSSELDDNFSTNDASTTSSDEEARLPPSTSSNCGKNNVAVQEEEVLVPELRRSKQSQCCRSKMKT